MTTTPIDQARALWHDATHHEEWPDAVPVTIYDSGELYPRETFADLLVPIDPNAAPVDDFESIEGWRASVDAKRQERRQHGERYKPRHRAEMANAWRP